MKKSAFYLMIVLMSLIAIPATTFGAETSFKANDPTPKEVPVEIQRMLDRVDEIREMDRSNLSRTERKELRKELREIKKEVKAAGGGIYISVGAIIIILLLIIIL